MYNVGKSVIIDLIIKYGFDYDIIKFDDKRWSMCSFYNIYLKFKQDVLQYSV